MLGILGRWFNNRKSVHSNNIFAGFRYNKTWLLMIDKNNPDNIIKRIEIPATTNISVASSNRVVTYDAESYNVLAGGVVRQPNTLSITATLLKSQINDIELFAKPGVLFYVYHSMPIGGLISSQIDRKLRGKRFQITGISYNSVGYVNSIEVEIEAVEINVFSIPKIEVFIKKKESGSGSGGAAKLPKNKEELYLGSWSTDAIKNSD